MSSSDETLSRQAVKSAKKRMDFIRHIQSMALPDPKPKSAKPLNNSRASIIDAKEAKKILTALRFARGVISRFEMDIGEDAANMVIEQLDNSIKIVSKGLGSNEKPMKTSVKKPGKNKWHTFVAELRKNPEYSGLPYKELLKVASTQYKK